MIHFSNGIWKIDNCEVLMIVRVHALYHLRRSILALLLVLALCAILLGCVCFPSLIYIYMMANKSTIVGYRLFPNPRVESTEHFVTRRLHRQPVHDT